MKKPRAMVSEGFIVASMGNEVSRGYIRIGDFCNMNAFSLKEARRLRSWLDKAIAWMEESENNR